jgi:hypothetical protein
MSLPSAFLGLCAWQLFFPIQHTACSLLLPSSCFHCPLPSFCSCSCSCFFLSMCSATSSRSLPCAIVSAREIVSAGANGVGGGSVICPAEQGLGLGRTNLDRSRSRPLEMKRSRVVISRVWRVWWQREMSGEWRGPHGNIVRTLRECG